MRMGGVMKKAVICLLLAAAGSAHAQGTGPFCVHVTNLKQCFYYSVESCQDAARFAYGLCAPNEAAPARPSVQTHQFSPLGAMNHVSQAGEAGRQRGLERRANADDGIAAWEKIAADAEADQKAKLEAGEK
jgi:hypothetical protein